MAEDDVSELHSSLKLGLVEQQIGALSADTRRISEEVRDGFQEMRKLIERIIVIEERRSVDADGLRRAHEEIAETNKRIAAVQSEIKSLQTQHVKWREMIAGGAAVGGILVALTLWIFNDQYDPLRKLPAEIAKLRYDQQMMLTNMQGKKPDETD